MPFQDHTPIPRKSKISVTYMVNQLRERVRLDLHAAASDKMCDQKFITDTELHRPGLALTGHIELFTWKRIQIIGNTESHFLKNLTKSRQKSAFEHLLQFDIPVIILTSGNKLPDHLIRMSEKAGIPIFYTEIETTQFMYLIRDFLEDQFSVQTMVHGTMVDVYGIGILIAGKSGIGKSEVALDLIERGHRLVSDDVVILSKKNNLLISSATELNKHFMEIRGLGIIDVMSMFGIRSIRYQKRLEVVLNLSLWEENQTVERTGLNHDSVSILDAKIPLIHLPITPGKNITVIAEVIAMNYLLEHYGYDAAQAFQNKVKNHISQKKEGSDMPKRAIEYFEGDFE